MPFTGGSYSKTKTFANSGTVLPADLNSIQDDIGGQLNTALIRTGVSDSSVIRRGKAINKIEETRVNTAFGLLPSPDRVQSVVMPTDGLIFIAYMAKWKESVSNAARAAIFLGANQLKVSSASQVSPQLLDAPCPAAINNYVSLYTSSRGLCGATIDTAAIYSGDVTTGQIVGGEGHSFDLGTDPQSDGGPVTVFAAAGTYDVSIQFKASSGSVTVDTRSLWVWTMGF